MPARAGNGRTVRAKAMASGPDDEKAEVPNDPPADQGNH
jgi:hypothetical protein